MPRHKTWATGLRQQHKRGELAHYPAACTELNRHMARVPVCTNMGTATVQVARTAVCPIGAGQGSGARPGSGARAGPRCRPGSGRHRWPAWTSGCWWRTSAGSPAARRPTAPPAPALSAQQATFNYTYYWLTAMIMKDSAHFACEGSPEACSSKYSMGASCAHNRSMHAWSQTFYRSMCSTSDRYEVPNAV